MLLVIVRNHKYYNNVAVQYFTDWYNNGVGNHLRVKVFLEITFIDECNMYICRLCCYK